MNKFFHIKSFGECGLLVILGDEIDEGTNQQVHLLKEWITSARIQGVLGMVPAYSSLLLEFDPFQVEEDVLRDLLSKGIDQISTVISRHNKVVEIPTIYGGDHGPDLDFVAEYTRLSPSEVIHLHSEVEYTVFMMGFSPGFPYLGGMNPAIAVPRLSSPRTRIPAGSVGIAGKQTGIYPTESAGGWRLIGWTPMRLFDPDHEPHFLLKPGDRIRFIPVPQE